ncbi:MAG: ATP-binding protein [Flavisolibacter sp.]|jgi:NadR type nicotinamide-nucleotide adenylyltransferase|nr:ATP-binding protein [Flavisolibacter sp.]
MEAPKKIVVIGPESTGKSTISQQLADHYATCWCPEFARAYLLKNGKSYDYQDLLHIAKGQVELEENYQTKAKNGLYIIDTNLYVVKVWCEVAFGQCHKWILDEIARRPYDLYLLCKTDLPWTADELREYPDPVFREQLYKMYRDLLINDGTEWAEISGKENERLQTAIRAIDHFLAG